MRPALAVLALPPYELALDRDLSSLQGTTMTRDQAGQPGHSRVYGWKVTLMHDPPPGIPMGISETGLPLRPRGPFEPRHAAPEPAPPEPKKASPRRKPAIVLAGVLALCAAAGAAGTAVWDWQVGVIDFGTVLVGTSWVLLAIWVLKRYTAMPEPPCLHAVLGRTEGNIARACCNAARCPLLHPEDLK